MRLNHKKIFITGATGLIGSLLTKKLLDSGYKVVVLSRDKNKVLIKHKNLQVVEGDMCSHNYLPCLNDCQTIVHLAAYQNFMDFEYQYFYKTNVIGTKKLLSHLSIVKHKPRLIYVSTAMVFQQKWHRPASEQTVIRKGSENNYLKSKIEAIKIIKKYSKNEAVVNLFPSVVLEKEKLIGYGNNKTKLNSILQYYLGIGIPGVLMSMIGNKNRVFNYIFLDDLVDGILRIIDSKINRGNYILAGHNISAEDYIKQISNLRKINVLLFRFPKRFVSLISKLASMFGGYYFDALLRNWPQSMFLDNRKMIRELGITPKSISQLTR